METVVFVTTIAVVVALLGGNQRGSIKSLHAYDKLCYNAYRMLRKKAA